ncbi:MAG: preprotein translocase subunit SecG [Oligoflexales bacterium]
METFVTIIHVCTAIFMILVVLVQGGNSGGVGAAFGGGNSQGVFGAAGATSFLGKLTYAMAAVFMVTSISLSTLQGTAGKTGLKERLQQKTEETKGDQKQPEAAQPAKEPAAPATPQ